MNQGNSLQRFARIAAGAAGISGAYGFLKLMGAFGPVSCWVSQASGDSSGSDAPTTEVTRGCEAGVDYLLGSTGGNAPVLFFWAVVLLGLSGLGVFAIWTDRQVFAWISVGVGIVITIIGMFSIGMEFLFPTLFLFTAATALTIQARTEAR